MAAGPDRHGGSECLERNAGSRALQSFDEREVFSETTRVGFSSPVSSDFSVHVNAIVEGE